jgi:thiosulfate/3-mercaptopyruvate sulfurtransferase
VSFGPLVSVDWLAEHLHDPDLRIIDFRWTLAGGSGADKYAAGHIPGAVFVDMDEVTGEGPGRHPLPSREQFESAMRRAGVDDAMRVAVYDEIGGSVASRLWFLLRFFGHEAQAVVDGGIMSWGGALEKETPAPSPGDFHAKEPDRSQVLDFDAVRKLNDVPLLDSRLGERYRGEVEPVDPKPGHIPGALSAPYPENLDSNGRFLPPEKLRERFKKLGVKKGKGAVVYCGSGVNATHNLLAMALAGIDDVRLYNGSWSDWSRRDDAPVATGPNP